MSINFCLGSQSNFHSWLIKRSTQSQYSHTWIEYDSPTWNGMMAVHAVGDGVTIEPTPNVQSRYKNIKRFSANNIDNIEDGFKKVYTFIGKPYGYVAAIWNLFLFTIAGVFGKKSFTDWIRSNLVFRDHKTYLCSEVTTRFLQAAGVPEALKVDAELQTPEDTYHLYKTVLEEK